MAGGTDPGHTLSRAYGFLQHGMSTSYTVGLAESPAPATVAIAAGDENRSTSIALNVTTIFNLVTDIIPPRDWFTRPFVLLRGCSVAGTGC